MASKGPTWDQLTEKEQQAVSKLFAYVDKLRREQRLGKAA